MAKTEKQDAMVFPIQVCGTLSPYPMVVTVTFENERGKLHFRNQRSVDLMISHKTEDFTLEFVKPFRVVLMVFCIETESRSYGILTNPHEGKPVPQTPSIEPVPQTPSLKPRPSNPVHQTPSIEPRRAAAPNTVRARLLLSAIHRMLDM